MNKVLPVSVLGLILIATACTKYALDNNKPDYLQSAETRVGSYLTSDYGRVTCTSKPIRDDHWGLDCLNTAKGQRFEFTVLPAEKAPYAVSRSFYLEAVNDTARQSAQQGLMRYLQINTDNPASQS